MNDPTIPCIKYAIGISASDQTSFTGAIKCTDKYSLEEYPFFCSENMQDQFLFFDKIITSEKIPQDYLKKILYQEMLNILFKNSWVIYTDNFLQSLIILEYPKKRCFLQPNYFINI